jgi:guanylate kinase
VSRNIEIKFIQDREQRLDELFRYIQIEDERYLEQEDIYLYGNHCYFKLRINERIPAHILKYNRLTSPVLRESRYEKVTLDDSTRPFAEYTFRHVKRSGTVKKKRRQLQAKGFLINIDSIFDDDWTTELYSVVEIEHTPNKEISIDEKFIGDLLSQMAVKPYHIMPYSNIHMVNMMKRSKIEREKFRAAKSDGALILIDGGSGTGKSTIKEMLVNDWNFFYAKRDTTRAPRADDFKSGDYNFVSRDEFEVSAIEGRYIEFRDFLFGMSYGLPWNYFIDPLCAGAQVMALINLGNGFFTKTLFPEATVILLHADVNTIRQRLEARGTITREQIEERLENNRLALTYIAAYDYHINTSEHSASEVAEIIVGTLPQNA